MSRVDEWNCRRNDQRREVNVQEMIYSIPKHEKNRIKQKRVFSGPQDARRERENDSQRHDEREEISKRR